MVIAQAQSNSGMAFDLLLLLMAAGFSSLLLGRLRMSAIPGYLIAGVLLGAIRTPTSDIDFIQQIAVVLLMFGIGLNLDRDAITRGAGAIITLGVVSTVLMMALATPAAMAFGLHWTASLAIAMAVAQTSTAVVLRTLQSRRELETSWGRVCFGVLIVQDLLTIIMLALIPVLAKAAAPDASAATEGQFWENVGQVVGSIAVIAGFILASTLILPRLLTFAAKVSTEVMLVISAAVALAAAAVTGAVGMSPALGAFIAGFVLAGTPVRYELSGQLAPLRDLFMAVFFTAVGLGVNLEALASDWWIVLVGAIVVGAIKVISMAVTAWGLGASIHIAAMTSIVLFQTGEFSLVVVSVAASEGLLSARQESVFIGLTAVLLIVTPSVINGAGSVSSRLSRHVPTAPWMRKSSLRSTTDTPLPELDDEGVAVATFELRDHVLIAGFGPVGRAVADKLHVAGVPYSVVDLNPTTVVKQRRLGRAAFYGDVTNEEVMRSAGIERAMCIVIAIPDDAAMLRGVRLARHMAPTAMIVARAFATSRGLQARGLGATHVVIEELVTAEAMSSQVLSRLGAMGKGTPQEKKPPGGAPSNGA